MMTVEKMIAWLRDNDTPDDHETRLQIADEFEKHVNSLVISGGMYRSKQAELETALLRLDAAVADKDEAIARMLRTERRLEASENRWKLAMDRLHNRFGDSLAVHMADIKALMALGDQREAVTGGAVERCKPKCAHGVSAGEHCTKCEELLIPSQDDEQ